MAQVNKHWLHLVENPFFNQTAILSLPADKIFDLKNWQEFSNEIRSKYKLNLDIIPEKANFGCGWLNKDPENGQYVLSKNVNEGMGFALGVDRKRYF